MDVENQSFRRWADGSLLLIQVETDYALSPDSESASTGNTDSARLGDFQSQISFIHELAGLYRAGPDRLIAIIERILGSECHSAEGTTSA